jgi:hypothetical protein
MTVIPAYGRDYKSAKAVKEAWAAGKDFVITGMTADSGRYINLQDAKNYACTETIMVRYKELREIVKVYP